MPHRSPHGSLPPVSFASAPGSAKPDAQAIVRLGMAGHPIELENANDYFALFHAMDRMDAVVSHRLMRKQTAPGRWLAYIVPLAEYRAIETASRAGQLP